MRPNWNLFIIVAISLAMCFAVSKLNNRIMVLEEVVETRPAERPAERPEPDEGRILVVVGEVEFQIGEENVPELLHWLAVTERRKD